MNIKNILILFLWIGSVPVALILFAVFAINKNMARGYWIGFFLLLICVFTGLSVVEPSMHVNFIMKYGLILSVPYLAVYSLFAIIMESLSWFLNKQNISGTKYDWWMAGGTAAALIGVLALILWTPRVMGFLPPFVAIFYYYWWLFLGLIVVWCVWWVFRSPR